MKLKGFLELKDGNISEKEKEEFVKEFHSILGTFGIVKCECGSEKAKSFGHSTWCPKYEEV